MITALQQTSLTQASFSCITHVSVLIAQITWYEQFRSHLSSIGRNVCDVDAGQAWARTELRARLASVDQDQHAVANPEEGETTAPS